MKPLPPIEKGFARGFYSCKECGKPMYHDYVPYSLSAGIPVLPCGHGLTIPFGNAVNRITEKQFHKLRKKYETKLTKS